MLGRDPAESGTGLEDGAIHRVLLVDLVSVGHDCAGEGGCFGRGPSHGVGRGSNCRVGRGATGWWSVATGASDVPSVHLTGACLESRVRRWVQADGRDVTLLGRGDEPQPLDDVLNSLIGAKTCCAMTLVVTAV